MATEFVSVKDLSVIYPGRGGRKTRTASVQAVRGATFNIAEGETLSLVGQSGSGKSTIGRVLCKLLKVSGGEVAVGQFHLDEVKRKDSAEFRRTVQIVFQDPYEALDPRYTISESIEEPLRALTTMTKAARHSKVVESLRRVEIDESLYDRFPHELSGGQRQRAAVARALVIEPRFIVLDEPVSMLDVSIQAGVLQLLRDLQSEFQIAYLFITHDLAVARYMGDRVAVMKQGEIVEIGPADAVVDHPQHAYTRLLLDSVPAIRGLGT